MPSNSNKAFLSAYNKGVNARNYGLLETANPYPDKRTSRGRVTFSRAFRKYWLQGWHDAKPAGFRLLRGRK